MRKALIVIIVLIGQILHAQSNYQELYNELIIELQNASKNKNNVERLKTYDQITANHKISLEDNLLEIKWIDSSSTNPLDDSRTIIFMLKADSGESIFGKRIYLVLRNQSGEAELYINWSSYLGSEVYVTTRIDKEPVNTEEWQLSTDNEASFYPQNVVEFIRRLKEAQTFVVKATPYNEDPIIAIFDMRGLADIINKYPEDINW